MRRSCSVFVGGLLTCLSLVGAVDTKSSPTPDQIQNIIKKFTQKETEFAAARESYTYRQTTKLEEIEPAGGTYEIVEEISFDNRNRRTSHVLYAPAGSLQNILMTQEDEEDFHNVMPFVMTNSDSDQYIVTYVGREQVDEIPCYVFSVKPKELTKDRKRYFDGQIWVDDQDLQIVKTYGRATGHLRRGEDQQFPKFETYRQQIDGKYWFPTYTYADDTLNFKDGQSQRLKEVIKYDQYKKFEFKSESTIQYGEVGGAKNDQSQPNSKTPPPPLRRRPTRINFGLVPALLAACACIVSAADSPALHVRNFGQVSSAIFRGAEPSESALRDLAALHVKLIIDLREPGAGPLREKVEAEHLGMLYRNVPLRPWSAPTSNQVQTVLALLANQNASPTFVHCRRGKDRTGTVVACYRIEHDGWSNARALTEAESYGMSRLQQGMRAFVLHFSALQPTSASNLLIPAR